MAMPIAGAAKYASIYKTVGFGSMALGGPVLLLAGVSIGILGTVIANNKKKQKKRNQ